MEKVVAILTQKGSLSKGVQTNTKVNIFRIENEKVAEVESVNLESTTDNYFSLFMKIKRVSIIYADTINVELKKILERIGIKTKCREELQDDMFINQFIFD